MKQAIIAAFSLFYPVSELAKSGKDANGEQRIQLLGQFLSVLKPGGVLYIEKDCLLGLLAQAEEIQDPQKLKKLLTGKNIESLEKRIFESTGIKIKIGRLPQIMGQNLTATQCYVRQPQIQQGDSNMVQMCDAYAFVRSS